MLRNFERLVPFLDAADRLTKPIDVLSNGVPFLPYIWAPLKLIVQISQDHMHALDEILSAYGRIGASLPRLSRYGNAFPDSHDFQQLLGHIYEDIIDFHCHAYRLVQKPGWAMLFSTCWGRFQHRYDSLLDSIAKTSELIDREAASYEIVQAREWRQKLLEEAQDREKKEEIHQREAVNKWLQVSDRNEEKLERLHNRCLDGTSQWVTASAQVRSWLQRGRGNPILWLHGKPGSGRLHPVSF
ncbi:hypothetical protein CSIM01_09536 [Colletotrichum simmondsii]|uniref:Uncharacterized protein n=1 Tax=Colletotrichum simmondsii TaxID=703756 RepID=A0A135T986_9PEZI|nr:hypothetical protein CSIM01_09536 [Colletotrichum simmondsii]